MRILLTSLCLIISSSTFAQITNEQLDSIINKSILDAEIDEVIVVYRTPKELAKLKRDVRKAYPFALRAASIINQIEAHTKTIKSKRKQRKYLKKKEKLMRKQFEDNLRNLTKTQGRYMVRLINRETDNTVYNLIKEYKNGANAVLWQAIAKRFNSDLKSKYNPSDMESIDFEIEEIVSTYSDSYRQRIKDEVIIEPPTYRDFQ